MDTSSQHTFASLPFLKKLKLADPMSVCEQFNIFVQIGHYWDVTEVIEKEIIRGQVYSKDQISFIGTYASRRNIFEPLPQRRDIANIRQRFATSK